MFGFAPWVIIAWLATAAMVPLGYQAGRLVGSHEQAATDRVQADLESARAVAAALEKARDDAATITLRQVEATQRERAARKAAEVKITDLEAEALEKDAKTADFVCPPVVVVQPAAVNPTAPAAEPAPVEPKPVPAIRRCELDDGDLAWLRRAYPPGPIHRGGPAASPR